MNIGLIDVDGHNKKDMGEEIWKPAVGYEKYIEVSNIGRVRTIPRFYVNSRGQKKYVRQRITSCYTMKKGYKVATIYLYDKGRGIMEKVLVHRLVATAFIPNPFGLPQINHKDENKQNNIADNLEWCSVKYNLDYGTRRQREIKAKSKPVNQMDMDGNFIKRYASITEAARFLGLSFSNISAVCRKVPHFRSAGGYKWEFA